VSAEAWSPTCRPTIIKLQKLFSHKRKTKKNILLVTFLQIGFAGQRPRKGMGWWKERLSLRLKVLTTKK
jgi:hypothetical protein